MIKNLENYVPKGWGYEKWICNNGLYCGKELFVVGGKRFSLHFHKIKDETFYVLDGEMVLRYQEVPPELDLQDELNCRWFPSSAEEVVLRRGHIFHVPVLLAHQVIGITDVKFIEFSTHHEDSDSYRIIKGD